MITEEKSPAEISPSQESGSNRRRFLQRAAMAGAVGLATVLPSGLPFANA